MNLGNFVLLKDDTCSLPSPVLLPFKSDASYNLFIDNVKVVHNYELQEYLREYIPTLINKSFKVTSGEAGGWQQS